MSTKANTMRGGLPVNYWRSRYLVAAAQILIVVFLIGAAVVWALTDGNGIAAWNAYYAFAIRFTEHANEVTSLPWE